MVRERQKKKLKEKEKEWHNYSKEIVRASVPFYIYYVHIHSSESRSYYWQSPLFYKKKYIEKSQTLWSRKYLITIIDLSSYINDFNKIRFPPPIPIFFVVRDTHKCTKKIYDVKCFKQIRNLI